LTEYIVKLYIKVNSKIYIKTFAYKPVSHSKLLSSCCF